HLIDNREEIPFLFYSQDFIFSNGIHESPSSISIENQVKKKAEVKKITAGDGSPLDFLKQENLLQNLNTLIEQSGIIGETNSRLLLFIIASSYTTKQPLHAIVQGSSGSGKTHLISK